MVELLKISLKAARVNAEMSQEDVAKALGKAKQTIVNWENGKTAIPAIELQNLCNLYRVPLDCIFLPSQSSLS